MDLVERLIERAKARQRTVALPEGDDPRVLQASRRLHDEGIARPILIGARAALDETAASAGVSLDEIESVAPAESGALDAYAALYLEGRPKANERVARRSLAKPQFCGAMAAKAGEADALVAGASRPTARLIDARLMSVVLVHDGRISIHTAGMSGPEAGAVVVFGLTADRKGPTVFPMLRASRWIADCPGSRGAEATNADPDINPDAEIFNTRTWAGGTWLRNAMSERGDDFEAAMGSNPVRSYPAESELPRTHRPPIVDMIEAERVRRQRGRWCDRSGLTLRRSSGGDRGVWRRSSPCRLAGRVWHDSRSRPLANCLPHARFPSAALPARRSGGGKDAPRPLARSAGTFPARPARSRGKPETHRVRFGPPGPRGCPGPPAH